MPDMIFTSQADRAALEERSRRAAQENLEPSKTQQGHAHDCDINTIAKAFGLNPRNAPVPPEVFDPRNYADLTEVPDLQTILNLALDAQNQFARLPADLRSMFNHDPVALWDFVQDPANGPKAVELGLLVDPNANVAPAVTQVPSTPSPG